MAAEPQHRLSPELRQFIAAHIQSVEQLEILILLAEEPGKCWAESEIYQQVQSSKKSVIACLEGFKNARVAELLPDGRYRLAPDHKLAEVVTALGETYRKRRVSVIESIHKSEPIHGDTAQCNHSRRSDDIAVGDDS
jgi:hypothetical protein